MAAQIVLAKWKPGQNVANANWNREWSATKCCKNLRKFRQRGSKRDLVMAIKCISFKFMYHISYISYLAYSLLNLLLLLLPFPLNKLISLLGNVAIVIVAALDTCQPDMLLSLHAITATTAAITAAS